MHDCSTVGSIRTSSPHSPPQRPVAAANTSINRSHRHRTARPHLRDRTRVSKSFNPKRPNTILIVLRRLTDSIVKPIASTLTIFATVSFFQPDLGCVYAKGLPFCTTCWDGSRAYVRSLATYISSLYDQSTAIDYRCLTPAVKTLSLHCCLSLYLSLFFTWLNDVNYFG